MIVFVEVKARSTSDFGFSVEFVDKNKRKRLKNCINFFIQKFKVKDCDFRFDIIGFDGNKANWIKNVFLEG